MAAYSRGEEHGYPASVEDDETADVSDGSVAASAQRPGSMTSAVEDGDGDDNIDTLLQSQDPRRLRLQSQLLQEQRAAAEGDLEDRRCLAEMLQRVQLHERAPLELQLPFYHATVVRDRSSLSDEGERKASELAATLRQVTFTASGRGSCAEHVTRASIGELDPSCYSRNDFLPYATSIAQQFELAYEQSGILFVCLGEGQTDRTADGWLRLVTDDSLVLPTSAQRAAAVFVFLDEAAAQSQLLRSRGYRVEALLSGNVSLPTMLEPCLPRWREWLSNQNWRLQQWQHRRARELLMEERERRHQIALSHQQLLRSLQEQRSAHLMAATGAAAAPSAATVSPMHSGDALPGGGFGTRGSSGSYGSPCRPMPSTIHSWSSSPIGSCGSAALMPSAQDLVRFSCIQKPVKHYYEGENWKNVQQRQQSGIMLLYGLPGVGKTQTALRFADFIRQQKPDNVFVYLFHFDTPEAFTADVNRLGEQLHVGTLAAIASTPYDQFCSLMQALKSPLYASVHKVLILDGADASRFSDLLGKTSMLESWLDRRTDFLFLLTATSCEHYEAVHTNSFDQLEIEPLSSQEVELVMRSDKHFKNYQDLPALAHRLRTELCGLPLGVFPALAYMRRTHCTVDQYVRRLDDPEVVADHVLRSPEYQHTVRQAVRLAVTDLLDQKRKYSSSRANLVLLVACFARQDLPVELLRSCLSLRSARRSGSVADDSCDCNDADSDAKWCEGAGGCHVDDIVSDLKVACLFENTCASYMDVPLVTVHKVVHDAMMDILLRDPTSQLDEVLDMALRGAFVEVEIDTRQQRSREHAILLHPHILHVTAIARDQYSCLAERSCARLCLIYLLQAAAYLHLESGDVEAAVSTSTDALDRFCELLSTSRDAMLAACNRVAGAAGGSSTSRGDGSESSSGHGSFGACCPLVQRLDALARATRMSRLLRMRRAHVTTKEWPGHMTSSDYAQCLHDGKAIDAGRQDAFFPYELLAAVLYMHGRALKHAGQTVAAGASYRLCLFLCEHVRCSPGGVPLVYELLAQRSGMRCLHPPPGGAAIAAAAAGSDALASSGKDSGNSRSEAVWLHDTIVRYRQVAHASGEYYQMGMRKLQPHSDDLHQLLCCLEIVRCLRRLHQLAAEAESARSTADVITCEPSRPHAAESAGAVEDGRDAGVPTSAAPSARGSASIAMDAPMAEALAIQRESFARGEEMLVLAKAMDASLRGPCYIEHGHLTLQMLAQNGATHAVPYYGCGLAELIKVGMSARVVQAVCKIVSCHFDLGRVPSDDLFGMVTSHLDMLRDSCVPRVVSEARSRVDSLQAVHKLYQVIKANPGTGAQRLNKAFGTVAPQVACRASSTMEEEQAYAWHEAARGIGYSDASIMKECRLLLK